MQKEIKIWLEKPQGRYQEGVAIFEACASPEIKKKYLEYFKKETGEPKQFAPHFTVLVSKVSDIHRNMRLNPEAFKDVKLTFVQSDNSELLAEKERQIEELKSEKEELEIQIEELEDDAETNAQEIADKEAEVEELEQKLETLGADFESLKQKRGIQIVHYDNLPDEIRKKYERVREITPLMANLHAEISVDRLHHATRAKLVRELVALDDERRAAWDVIDDWAEGKNVGETLAVALAEQKPTLEFSTDDVVKGAQIERRTNRLKENIARSQKVADNTAERKLIRENALKRVEAYKAELEELEKLIKKDE